MRHATVLIVAFTSLLASCCALRVPGSRHKVPMKVQKAGPSADTKSDATGLMTAASSLAVYASLPIMPVLAAEQNLALSVGRPVLDSFVNIMSLLMIIRTVLSWYPKTDLRAFPYVIAVWPTEPLLAPVRAIVPPAFGVDVSSLVWVGVLSFIREVFTGQQGILTLMEKYPGSF